MGADIRETARVLADLEQRLSNKTLTLSELSDANPDVEESRRLRHKAEGVDLALSFVQEAIRSTTSCGEGR